MRPILLLLLLVLLAATSLGFIPDDPEWTNPDQFAGEWPPDMAWVNAQNWQNTFNKYVVDGAESLMRHLFVKDFEYEHCDGTKMGWVRYVEIGFADPFPRKVFAARADKNHVIFKVEYLGSQQEIMITVSHGHFWKAEKAMGLIC